MGRAAQTLLGLIAIAALSAPACRSKPKVASPVATSADAPQTTLKMFGIHVQSFSDTRLGWDVVSPFGEMYTNNNAMRLHHMISEFYDNGQHSGEVSSDLALFATGPNLKPINGVKLDDGDAYLSDNVVMVSTDGTRVETDWAHYSHKNDLITSTAPVRVVRKDSITNGIGMEARADMSDLQIFHQTLVIPGTEESTQ